MGKSPRLERGHHGGSSPLAPTLRLPHFIHWLCAKWRPFIPRVAGSCSIDALLRIQPLNGPGWLSPKGDFFAVGHKNHGYCAFEMLEPNWQADGLIYDPGERDYEKEMEQRRYVKLMINDYFSGWCNPRFRLSRAQLNIMFDWYMDRERKLPDWFQGLYDD